MHGMHYRSNIPPCPKDFSSTAVLKLMSNSCTPGSTRSRRGVLSLVCDVGESLRMGDPLRTPSFIIIVPWSGLDGAEGGVPLLDPRPRDDDAVRDGACGCCDPFVFSGVGGRSQKNSFPYQVFFHSEYSFSSRILSKAARYLS